MKHVSTFWQYISEGTAPIKMVDLRAPGYRNAGEEADWKIVHSDEDVVQGQIAYKKLMLQGDYPKVVTGRDTLFAFVLLTTTETLIFNKTYNDYDSAWNSMSVDAIRERIKNSKNDLAYPPFGEDDICLVKDGVWINPSPDGQIGGWSGKLTKYSPMLQTILRALIERKVITEDSNVYLSRIITYKEKGPKQDALMGTASEVLSVPTDKESLSKVILYHGTSTVRYINIKLAGDGLKPVAPENRAWDRKSDKGHPDFRGKAVYLTADLDQARYYAQRTVKVDRSAGYKKVNPVVLKIVITKDEFDLLRADDDWLWSEKEKGNTPDPSDWYRSMTEFGQIALLRPVESDEIEVAEGNVQIMPERGKTPYNTYGKSWMI